MIISLGFNCYISMALRKTILNQPSLPFDSILNRNTNNLLAIYDILNQLRLDSLDIQNFITVDDNYNNNINFNLSHFYKPKHLNRVLTTSEKNNNQELYTIFSRRFNRLKNNFFNKNNPNLLIYKPKFDNYDNTIFNAIDAIIELNPINKILILDRTASRRKRKIQVSKNIEFVRCGRSSNRVEAVIQSYLTPEIKNLYENTIL